MMRFLCALLLCVLFAGSSFSEQRVRANQIAWTDNSSLVSGPTIADAFADIKAELARREASDLTSVTAGMYIRSIVAPRAQALVTNTGPLDADITARAGLYVTNAIRGIVYARMASLLAGDYSPDTYSGAVLSNAVVSVLRGRIAPVGQVVGWVSTNIPAGWLVCDGSAVAKTNYPALYTVLGETYGVHSNTALFYLPDYRGRYLRGDAYGAETNDPGYVSRTNVFGVATNGAGTLQSRSVASHNHGPIAPGVHTTPGAWYYENYGTVAKPTSVLLPTNITPVVTSTTNNTDYGWFTTPEGVVVSNTPLLHVGYDTALVGNAGGGYWYKFTKIVPLPGAPSFADMFEAVGGFAPSSWGLEPASAHINFLIRWQ